MPTLTYKLIDKENTFPSIYQYDYIDKDELALRFSCEYFVKDEVVYHQIDTVMSKERAEIYVEIDLEEKPFKYANLKGSAWGGIKVEFRKYMENESEYPLLEIREYHDDDDAILQLLSTLFIINGKEYSKTSSEVDEDRKLYVIYVE